MRACRVRPSFNDHLRAFQPGTATAPLLVQRHALLADAQLDTAVDLLECDDGSVRGQCQLVIEFSQFQRQAIDFGLERSGRPPRFFQLVGMLGVLLAGIIMMVLSVAGFGMFLK